MQHVCVKLAQFFGTPYTVYNVIPFKENGTCIHVPGISFTIKFSCNNVFKQLTTSNTITHIRARTHYET